MSSSYSFLTSLHNTMSSVNDLVDGVPIITCLVNIITIRKMKGLSAGPLWSPTITGFTRALLRLERTMNLLCH